MSNEKDTDSKKANLLFENHPLDCRYNGPLEVSPTIASVMGTGGNNGPIVLNCNNQNPHVNTNEERIDLIVSTEKYRKMGGNNLPLVANQSSYCIAGNIIDRQVQNGGNGLGCQEDISYTLTSSDRLSGCPDKRSNSEE